MLNTVVCLCSSKPELRGLDILSINQPVVWLWQSWQSNKEKQTPDETSQEFCSPNALHLFSELATLAISAKLLCYLRQQARGQSTAVQIRKTSTKRNPCMHVSWIQLNLSDLDPFSPRGASPGTCFVGVFVAKANTTGPSHVLNRHPKAAFNAAMVEGVVRQHPPMQSAPSSDHCRAISTNLKAAKRSESGWD